MSFFCTAEQPDYHQTIRLLSRLFTACRTLFTYRTLFTCQKLGLLCLCLMFGFTGLSSAAWASVDPLSVSGNKIYAGGVIKSFAGNSFFWSNSGWGGEKFYTAEMVSMLKQDWQTSIVRASMGIQESGGYLDDPVGNQMRIETIVDAAIANDLYVIIDWHSHHAEDNLQEAVDFFTAMARKYGDKPNVIYEVYNEPLQVSWHQVIKPYAETVIDALRAIDPDNLIVVGTPSWSQDVDVTSFDPIQKTNIAYALHFYAGTHGASLRTKAQMAMNNGIALFVTEWGAVDANGDGPVNDSETDAWVQFMQENDLSHVNWVVADHEVGSSMFYPNTTTLTPSGQKAKAIIQHWPNKIEHGSNHIATQTGWHGKQAAVVLSYDDALDIDLDHVIPVLDHDGLKATFYIIADSQAFKSRLTEWRHVAHSGHELGNHTMFHPCDASLPGREWVPENRDLSQWTKERFLSNIEITNVLLEAVDGHKQRTFAYTCGDTNAGGESIIPGIKSMFPGARGVMWGMQTLSDANLYDLKAFSVQNQTGDTLIAQVDQAIAQHSLLIFLFHGVGGGHDINVSQAAHDALIHYLHQRQQDVWVAPLREVTDFIQSERLNASS